MFKRSTPWEVKGVTPVRFLRPEPIVKPQTSFDPMDMESATIQRVARLGALFARRRWLEAQLGEDLDEMTTTLSLWQWLPDATDWSWAHADKPLNRFLDPEMDLPRDSRQYENNFLREFESVYQSIVADYPEPGDVDRGNLMLLWNKPSDKPDPRTEAILKSLQEAIERQKAGVGSKDFRPLLKASESAICENTDHLSPTGNMFADANVTIQENSKPADAQATVGAATPSDIPGETRDDEPSDQTPEQIKSALEQNTLQIRQTIQWNWGGEPRVSHAPIGVYQFLELMKLGEERLKILNWDETNPNHLRQSRPAWFINKSKMERILFNWPCERRTVFLNTLSLKKVLHIYELRKLRTQLIHFSLHWPMSVANAEAVLGYLPKLDRLINFLLTFATD